MTLTCELSKPDKKVKWLKNGKEIKPDKHIKFSVDQYQHQLVMTDVTLTDADKYTCVCGDVSTECTIKVDGELLLLYEGNIHNEDISLQSVFYLLN